MSDIHWQLSALADGRRAGLIEAAEMLDRAAAKLEGEVVFLQERGRAEGYAALVLNREAAKLRRRAKKPKGAAR